MSLLPVHRDVSSTPTVIAESTASQLIPPAPSSERSGSTHVGVGDEKASPSDDGYGEKAQAEGSKQEYIDKGILELDDEEGKRQVQVMLEQKSGRELLKAMGGGPYTQPRW